MIKLNSHKTLDRIAWIVAEAILNAVEKMEEADKYWKLRKQQQKSRRGVNKWPMKKG